MKKLSKIVAACLLSTALVGNVFAESTVQHGAAPLHKGDANGQYNDVYVNNRTGDSYTTSGNFSPSGKPFVDYLAPYGQEIFDIDRSFDNQVCFAVVRDFDHWVAWQGCLSSGAVNIGPYNAANSNKPEVKVSQ